MDPTNLTVSVLIPCFNQADLIEQVIAAVLAQTVKPDEIIVVDDGSQDNSVDILKTLPVRLIQHSTNLGLSQARNTAIQASRGDILVFIDGDALAAQNLIEVLLSGYLSSADPKLGGIGGQGIEAQQLTVYDRWRTYHARQGFGDKKIVDAPFLYGLCMSYKRSAIDAVGGFDLFYTQTCGEDVDLGIRLRRAGFRLCYLPQAIVFHQHTDDEKRLKKTHYNWAYWNYILKKRHSLPTRTTYAGIIRRLFQESLTDLFLRRDWELFKLDLEMFFLKMAATNKAAKIK